MTHAHPRRIVALTMAAAAISLCGPMLESAAPAGADSRCSRSDHSHVHWGNAHRDYDDFRSVTSYKQGGIWFNSYQHYRRTHGQWQAPAVCG